MKRKAISCLLVLASVLTMTPSIPTLAAENQAGKTVVNETLADENQADKTLADETQTGGTSIDGQQETNASGSKAVVVKYDQASSFTVTIQKSIVLDSNKTANYNVKVKGDVLGNEIITVIPDQTVILNDANGKDPVTGNIAQEKTEFSSTEVNQIDGTKTKGNIAADDLTSGDWSGTFKFIIGTNQIGNETIITSENLTTYGINTTGDVVIPEYVTDDDNTRHAISGIGTYAFRNCTEMTSVTIADSVTEIGAGAFVNCSKLSKVNIPNTVKSIGNSAFDGCSSLSSISYKGNEYDLSNIESAFVENGVSVGNHVFDHSYSEPVYTWSDDNSTCTATKTCSECHDVVTENGTITNNVKTPATCTVKGTTTYTATFKDTAFGTQTKDVQNIAALGHTPVNGYCTRCNEKVAGLYDVNGAMICSWEDSGINNTCSNAATIIKNTYTSTKKVVIPDGVTSIGYSAFKECEGLTSVTIPEGVTSIGKWAFLNCKSLTSITIPKSVTSIGESAFYNCASLTSVTIPEGVTSIGDSAFSNCTSLTSITIPEGVTSIGDSTFYNCTNLTSITIPEGVTSIGRVAFYECTSLTSVTIPEGVTSIGNNAFYCCTELTSVTIPNSVKSIGNNAFYYCKSLTGITIPEGVTSIGDYIFSGCTELTSIIIPNSVTSIGKSAFNRCASLTSVTIPEGVTSIGDSAFSNCTSLTSVTIPNSVTSIGEWAFMYVPHIYYHGTATGSPWGAKRIN